MTHPPVPSTRTQNGVVGSVELPSYHHETMRFIPAAFCVVALAAGGCFGQNEERSGSPPGNAGATESTGATPTETLEPADVVVTRSDPGLPCSPSYVAGAMESFFGALEEGATQELDGLFASAGDEPPAFQWYSVTIGDPNKGGQHFVTGGRADLLPYFARRHVHSEQMHLIMLDVGESWVRDSVGFTFAITRNADDLPQGAGGSARIAFGKGELHCPTRQFYVWSMGMDLPRAGVRIPRSVRFNFCPTPQGWKPLDGPAIACARA
jgi:hypothetical protein